MGAGMGRMRVYDLDLDSRKLEVHEIAIDMEVNEPWALAEKRRPLDLEKTTFRILSIFMVSQPEIKIFGKRADEITQIVLRSEKTEVEWGPNQVEDWLPIHLRWKLCGVKDQIYVLDAFVPEKTEESEEIPGEEPGRLVLVTIPAGTKLVAEKKISWDSLHSNNFYVESDATKYAADGGQRVIVLSEDMQFNADTFWPGENTVLEATSYKQLDELYSVSRLYAPKEPKPSLGPHVEELDFDSIASVVEETFGVKFFMFMISNLTEDQRPCNPATKRLNEEIEEIKQFIASAQ